MLLTYFVLTFSFMTIENSAKASDVAVVLDMGCDYFIVMHLCPLATAPF